jgi:hypothetical protein
MSTTTTMFDPSRARTNVVRLFEDGIGLGRPELVDRYVAAGARRRAGVDWGDVDLTTHLRTLASALSGCLPDLRVRVRNVVNEDHVVALRVMVTGTPLTYPWFGSTTARRPLRHESFHFVRCDAFGRAAEMWSTPPMEEILPRTCVVGSRRAA